MAGAIFENYVITEILKKEKHNNEKSSLYYMRTQDGYEVGLIFDRRQTREWIEIKKSETFREKMLRGIHKLKPKDDRGMIIYNGKSQPYLPDIDILNYEDYIS